MDKAHILFLEDEEIIREVLTEYLKIAGYQVTQTDHGQGALDLLLDQNFDLAILDIMVPGISGLEVLQEIHQIKPQLPVIMLTALGDDKTQVEAFNAQADDYIIKPVSPIILLKRVETILRRIQYSNGQMDRQLKETSQPVEEILIDKQAYRASFKGQDLELTVSEFLLLQALSSHPGQVLSRDQLIDHVFGPDYFCSDRIIDTHIKNLRKKLPIDCIKTVIGLGYCYEVK